MFTRSKHVLFTTLAAALLLSSPARLQDQPDGAKTLTRVEDFIVVIGSDLSGLDGAEIGNLRLYSCYDTACAQVPSQVDQRDSLGRYVFPEDANRDRDGSALDANDELSFMAEDAGGLAPEGWWPAAATRGVEIEVIDPLDQGRAWVYLFEEPDSPAPELADYVDYRVENGQILIESDQMMIGYPHQGVSYDVMRMITPAGVLGPDVLDQQRMGVEGILAGDLGVAFSAPESIVATRNIGLIDGPVRVIVDEVVDVVVGEFSFQWGVEYFFKIYRCGHHNSVTYEIPIAATAMFKSVNFYWDLDFTNDVLGSFFTAPYLSEPVLIKDEDRMAPPGDSGHVWYGLWGDQGALVQAYVLDHGSEELFVCDTRWKQKSDPKVKRGEHPGRIEIGFNCHGIEDLPEENKYHASNYILFPRDPSLEGINSMKNVFENPLQIIVREMP